MAAATTSASAGLRSSPTGSPADGFARERGVDGRGAPVLEWRLCRNCSLSPRQLVAALGVLAVASLAVAALAWSLGATLVVPFTSIELAALVAAVVVYARHAGDRERLVLADGRLAVEIVDGLRSERHEFDAAWVRVETPLDNGGLVELSAQGRRLAIGRHLHPSRRAALARELRLALLAQRRT